MVLNKSIMTIHSNISLLKQVDIQSDRAHEKVDVAQTLACHGWGEGLGESDSLHDTILDCHDQSLLLLGTSTNSDRSKELPNVYIFASVDSAREDRREGGLERIEEVVVSTDPMYS